jgi:TolB protein
VTASQRQINEFGELPDRSDVPYFSRAAVSLRQHTFIQEGSDFDPNLSPNGDRMVFASTRHNEMPDLYIKSVDGVAVTQLTSDPAADVQPAFSPDGSYVAFASNRTGNWDIWIVAVDGQQPIQVTSGEADDIHPSWSPDGTQLVYCSLPAKSGQWELWVADAASDAAKRFIGYGLFPEWSPIGDTILYQRARERGSRWFSIWTIELIDGEPRYPTEIAASPDFAMISPSWSRDGKMVAYTTRVPPADAPDTMDSDLGQADVWVVNADGHSRVRLTDGHTVNYGSAWSRGGRVFFTSSREGFETIWSLMPLDAPGETGTASASGKQDVAERTGPTIGFADSPEKLEGRDTQAQEGPGVANCSRMRPGSG